MKNKKLTIYASLLLPLLPHALSAQTYAQWKGASAGTAASSFSSGTGSWDGGNFKWSIKFTDLGNDSSKIGGSNAGAYTESSEVHTNATIEGKYGNLDNNLRIQDFSGDTVAELTIAFDSPTPADWSFGVIDLDAENLVLTGATTARGARVSSATMDSWFKGVYDARPGTGADGTTGFDGSFGSFLSTGTSGAPGPTVLAEGDHASSPGAPLFPYFDGKYDTQIIANSTEGHSAWFAPNTSLSTLTMRWENRNGDPRNGGSANLASMHVWLATDKVPEPSSTMLVGLGCLSLLARRKR